MNVSAHFLIAYCVAPLCVLAIVARAAPDGTCPGLAVRDAEKLTKVYPDAILLVDAARKQSISELGPNRIGKSRELRFSRAPQPGDHVYVYRRGYEIGTAVFGPGAKPVANVELVKSKRIFTVKADPNLRGRTIELRIEARLKVAALSENLWHATTHKVKFSEDDPEFRISVPSGCQTIVFAYLRDGRPGILWPKNSWVQPDAAPRLELHGEPVRVVRIRVPEELRKAVSATVLPLYDGPPSGMNPERAQAIFDHLFSQSMRTDQRAISGGLELTNVPNVPVRLVFSAAGRQTIVELGADVTAVDLRTTPIGLPIPLGVPLVGGQAVRNGTIVVAGKVDLTSLLRISGGLRLRYPTLANVVRPSDSKLNLAPSEFVTVWNLENGNGYAKRAPSGSAGPVEFSGASCTLKWRPRPKYRVQVAAFPFWHGTRTAAFATPDERLWRLVEGTTNEIKMHGLAPGEYFCILKFQGEKKEDVWPVYRRFTITADSKPLVLDLG